MATAESARDRIAFLRALRAVRQFRPEPVPPGVVEDVLQVARWSGSASNRQPWEIVVIRDRNMLQSLAAAEGHARHLATAQLGIVLVMSGDPERFEHEAYDEGRLSERIMLAAAAHDVGSCIGWFVGDGKKAAKELLGIPAGRLVRTVISLGYPDEEARRAQPKRPQPRRPLTEIVHEERYS